MKEIFQEYGGLIIAVILVGLASIRFTCRLT